ncbi:MAG: alpha/beta hydrolase [Candidatus Scalindua sp.]|nr:alpha/beta hydrolase [Candidatus Scalindua sp.]MBT5307621.1 alpha/beta hydrolase [Candidatus Scalindua sp.]MBT7591990.1 alpha/beta hydrolase [Candidatus Scalindua sp.]
MIIPKFIEKKLIFHPDKSNDHTTPDAYGIEYDDVTFRTEDGLELHGWFIPGKKSSTDADLHTLLWFHGNSGNVNRRLDNIKMLHDRVPVNVFIFDYRQYGRSEGKITEQGTYMDARAALAYLHSRNDINSEKIIFFGRSLGSAVAVDLAVKEKCRALILETPFTSIKEMGKELYPFLPFTIFLRTKYDSLSKIRDIKVPTLIMHGDKDELVPIEQGKRLYEKANEPKEFYTIPGAMHNDTHIVGGVEYFDVIKNFVNKLEK